VSFSRATRSFSGFMTSCLYSPGVGRLGAAGEMFRIPAFLDHLSIEPCKRQKVGRGAAKRGEADSESSRDRSEVMQRRPSVARANKNSFRPTLVEVY